MDLNRTHSELENQIQYDEEEDEDLNAISPQNENEHEIFSPAQQTSFLFNQKIQITNNPNSIQDNNKDFSFYKLWKFTGPGLLISVAYFDPGNLESDLQSGALAGYKLLWVLLYSTIAGFLIQLLAVRLGSATGFHLAEICHREYGKLIRYSLWIMIEIAIIASDIQQVIGSAIALNLLSQGSISIWVGILITSLDVFIFLLLEKTGIRVIEAVFASFIALMGGSFLYMYIVAAPDQLSVFEGVIFPWCKDCSNIDVKQLVGIVGSIVMPHNIYFHSSLVLSRNFNRRSENAIKEANKYFGIELACALFIAFICNLFVSSVSAKSFFETQQSDNVTLFNAGIYIQNQYGLAMKIIWAIGLLSAGQCSTITGTYAGQFIMEGFTKINLKRWKRIIITRSISIVPCVIVTLSAYNSIDQLNFWCNVIQAIQLPFAMLPILHFTSSKRIMGTFRNNLFLKIISYLITASVLAINIYFLISLIIENKKLWSYILLSLLVVYLIFVTIFLLGVNNIYRIKVVFRNMFFAHNAEELDELLHTNPIYRRPERPTTSANANEESSIFSSKTSTKTSHSKLAKKNSFNYLINKSSLANLLDKKKRNSLRENEQESENIDPNIIFSDYNTTPPSIV